MKRRKKIYKILKKYNIKWNKLEKKNIDRNEGFQKEERGKK